MVSSRDSKHQDSAEAGKQTKKQYKVLSKYRKTQYIIAMPKGHSKTKTTTMTLRVTPELKAAAELAADREYRSLTGLIEVLIIKDCKAKNIPVNTSRRTANEPN